MIRVFAKAFGFYGDIFSESKTNKHEQGKERKL